MTYLALNQTTHRILPLDVPVTGTDIYFGFSRQSPCAPLAEYLSKRLEELDKNGVSENLLQKYLKGPASQKAR